MVPASTISEQVFFILLSLAPRPRHGYAILKEVAELSDGRITLSTGTLYGALSRLLDEGWIDRVEERETPRGRQTYRLTRNGRGVLRAEAARLERLARIAASQLNPQES